MQDQQNIERLLWSKMLTGDLEAFNKIYASNVNILYNYGLKLTPQTHIVEDCIHDVFVELLKKKKAISQTDSIEFYLLRSFRNRLFRVLSRERKSTKDSPNNSFNMSDSIEHEIINSEHQTANQKALAKAIESLSARQKEAIYLRFSVGLKYIQIAQIMGVEVNSCRNIICRATKMLRKLMTEKAQWISVLFFFKKK